MASMDDVLRIWFASNASIDKLVSTPIFFNNASSERFSVYSFHNVASILVWTVANIFSNPSMDKVTGILFCKSESIENVSVNPTSFISASRLVVSVEVAAPDAVVIEVCSNARLAPVTAYNRSSYS